MFSGLKIELEVVSPDGVKHTVTRSYTAFDILAMLQQATPGIQKPTGNGSTSTPWQPKTPSEWFYCAKVCGIAQRQVLGLGDGDSGSKLASAVTSLDDFTQYDKDDNEMGEVPGACLSVGKRYQVVTTGNLYSSDWGPTTNNMELKFQNSSYPVLWNKVKTDCQRWGDAAMVQKVVDLLEGKTCSTTALPLLTNVLFVSEVARNHTAFHTNLMALDLIRKGTTLVVNKNVPLTWELALWCDDEGCETCSGDGTVKKNCTACSKTGKVNCNACNGTGKCDKCGGTGRFHNGVCFKCQADPKKCKVCRGAKTFSCRPCGGTGVADVTCSACKGSGRYQERTPKGLSGTTAKGGLGSLQGGLLAMSHTGSAWGGAYSLAGEGDYYGVWTGEEADEAFAELAPITIVRRKEATLAIRWSSLALPRSATLLGKDDPLAALGAKSLSFKFTIEGSDFKGGKSEGEEAYKAQVKLFSELARLGEIKQRLEDTRRDLTSLRQDAKRVSRVVYSFFEARDKVVNDENEKVKGQLESAATDLAKDEAAIIQELGPIAITATLLALFQQRVSSFKSMLT